MDALLRCQSAFVSLASAAHQDQAQVHQRVMHVDLSTIVQYKSAGSGIVVL
jgi:hypothetical protein